METGSIKNALTCGRALRFIFGVYLLYDIHAVYLEVDLNGILIRLSWAIALVIFYYVVHLVVSVNAKGVNPILGAVLAFAPVLIVYFLGYGGPAATGALTFLGITLIIAAIRADPGCEVMSIPGLFSKKHTHLTCILFSPIDWVERKLSGR
jgi:hypothetical protein